MHGRGVLVTAPDGAAVGMGMLHVIEEQVEAGLRLELSFETESLRAQFRIPVAKLDALAATWDGALYRYALSSDAHPSLRRELSEPPAGEQPPVIETFSLPPNSPPSTTPPAPPASREGETKSSRGTPPDKKKSG